MKKIQVWPLAYVTLLVLTIGTSLPLHAENLVTPIPAIPGTTASALYKVWVNGTEVPVNDESKYDFHTAAFTMNGTVTVKVRFPQDTHTCQVLPSRHRIVPTIDDHTATFTVSEPLNLVVKTPGKLPLALLITPPDPTSPNPSDPSVVYFGPGIHEPGVIKPQSGQTIYLAPGALVKGRIEAKNVQNVTVTGRGILDTSAHSIRKAKTCGILFEKSSHITMTGIGVRGGTWWQTLFLLSEDIDISHVNLLGKAVNTDGIDIDGVKRLTARHCFIRCGDDGFGWHAVDAQANGEPVTENCTAEDCVIWNTVAGNGLRIGSSMETGLFQNITFRNIDVLESAEAAIRSDHSDWAWCKNIRFENFIAESPSKKFIEIVIAKTRYSNDTGFRDERGHYEGLTFVNVRSPHGQIVLKGYDATHLIDQVSFKNCAVGDKPIASRNDLITNAYVTNLTFSTALNP